MYATLYFTIKISTKILNDCIFDRQLKLENTIVPYDVTYLRQSIETIVLSIVFAIVFYICYVFVCMKPQIKHGFVDHCMVCSVCSHCLYWGMFLMYGLRYAHGFVMIIPPPVENGSPFWILIIFDVVMGVSLVHMNTCSHMHHTRVSQPIE